ncbi:hypothetical protein VNO78_03318 [Psophocarpus tetragonolobus]|uniref:Uncharacterized protein n=1 Tax=Psophocarpus tetragonolobus TaxID=3891 RepID=A0AAN9TDS8_PSOTE
MGGGTNWVKDKISPINETSFCSHLKVILEYVLSLIDEALSIEHNHNAIVAKCSWVLHRHTALRCQLETSKAEVVQPVVP